MPELEAQWFKWLNKGSLDQVRLNSKRGHTSRDPVFFHDVFQIKIETSDCLLKLDRFHLELKPELSELPLTVSGG